MSDPAAVISIVLLVFFLVGVTVGIITVIAVSARRADRAARRTHLVTPSRTTRPDLRQARPRRL